MADKPKPFPQRGALSAKFRATTPGHWRELIGDAERTREVRAFEERLERLRKQVAEHHTRHKRHWIDQEFARVITAKLPPRPALRPRGVRINLQDMRAEAARRVAARFEARKQRLVRAHGNMVARVMLGREAARNQPHNAPARDLVEEVHEIVARADRLRAACVAHARKHREEWIAAAQARGSENPQAEIFFKCMARMRTITTAEENILRDAFARSGHDHASARVKALSQSQVQLM